MNTPNDPMAEIRASFFIECEELLEALQDGLQTMEDGSDDLETVNVVFRAVHSIKGGAGAFGLEALVRFAHSFETVLDEVRSERMVMSEDALKVFFQAADHLADLVIACRDETAFPDTRTEELQSALLGFLGDGQQQEMDAPEPEIDFQPMGLSLDLGGDGPALPAMEGLPPLPPLADPATPESDAAGCVRKNPLQTHGRAV